MTKKTIYEIGDKFEPKIGMRVRFLISEDFYGIGEIAYASDDYFSIHYNSQRMSHHTQKVMDSSHYWNGIDEKLLWVVTYPIVDTKIEVLEDVEEKEVILPSKINEDYYRYQEGDTIREGIKAINQIIDYLKKK